VTLDRSADTFSDRGRVVECGSPEQYEELLAAPASDDLDVFVRLCDV
jgi:hypothetical protein